MLPFKPQNIAFFGNKVLDRVISKDDAIGLGFSDQCPRICEDMRRKQSYHDECRDRNVEVAGQEMLRICLVFLGAKKREEIILPTHLQRARTYQNVDFQPSKLFKCKCLFFLAYHFVMIYYGNPTRVKQYFIREIFWQRSLLSCTYITNVLNIFLW